MMERLDQAFGENRIYFRLPTNDDPTERANRIHVLAQLDVIMGEAYARDHKIKGRRGTINGKVADVKCRVYGGYDSKGYFKPNYWKKIKSFDLSEINAGVDNKDRDTSCLVKVGKERWNNSLRYAERSVFTLIKDRKGLNSKLKSDVQLLEEIGRTEFEVNTKKMLLKDIPHGKTIVYCNFHNKGKELEGFTLEELGLNPKDMFFISPTNKNIKDVKRLTNLIAWYFDDKDSYGNHSWDFQTNGGEYVKKALAKELGISSMSGDNLEKTAGLLRIRREIVDTYPHLYNIIKEAITWASSNNQDDMRELMLKHLEEIEQ